MKRFNITLWLLIGDWLVFLLFTFIGQRNHGMTGMATLSSLMATTQALAIPWTVTASAWGVAGFHDIPRYGWFGRVLTVWLIAAPIGLIYRALLRGESSISVTFMLVTLALGGLFILAWRAIAYRIGANR